jgi:hypothetical protein
MSYMLFVLALVAVVSVPLYVWGEPLAQIAGVGPSAVFAGVMLIVVRVIGAVGYRRRRSVGGPSVGAEITEMLDDQSTHADRPR